MTATTTFAIFLVRLRQWFIAILMGLALSVGHGLRAEDRAINFDNGAGHITVPNFHLAGVSDEVTVEFWANLRHSGNETVFVLESDDNGANRFQGQLSFKNGTTAFQCGTASVSAAASAVPYELLADWNHFAFVASASQNLMRIYINGELLAETTVGASTLFNLALGSYSLRIGGTNNGEVFHGYIDDFRVWNEARTQEQIRSRMIPGILGNETGLRLYYMFDEADPNDFPSTVTALNSATATGAAFHGTMGIGNYSSTPPHYQRWTAPARACYVVSTTRDPQRVQPGEPISLRYAVNEARDNGKPTLITFDPSLSGQTITLTQDELWLGKSERCGFLIVDASSLSNGITINAGSGANRVFHFEDPKQAQLLGLTLTGGDCNGHGEHDEGGAIYLGKKANVLLKNCTLEGNTAHQKGGAIFIESGCTLHMQGCTLSGNTTAGHGGAVFNSGTLTMSHCTLVGNDAYNGGAIESESSTTLNHCTISNNSSVDGGNLTHSVSTLTLAHCILAGNLARSRLEDNEPVEGVDIYNHHAGSVIQVGSNVIRFMTNENGAITGPAAFTADPLLRPLEDNGGPTKTMALPINGPARDASVGSAAITDQRGLPIVGVPDLGAFEVQASTVAVTRSDDSSVFGQSVTFTATVSGLTSVIATGTITFTLDGTPINPLVLNDSGVATLTTSALSVGPHTLTARYSGDVNLPPSISAPLTQSVNKSNTTVALVSSLNPSTVGISVAFTATVAAAAPNAGTPTGSVIFSIDGTPQPSSALSDGLARFTTNALGTGTHHITASYQGSGDFNASASSPLAETVNDVITLSGTLPQGYAGTPYSHSLSATGGTGTKTLVVTNLITGGTGLTAPRTSANTATLNGTPTGPGTLSFDLTATDVVGAKTTKSYSLTVLSLVVSTTSLTGFGSLKEALATAAQLPGPDTITFTRGMSGRTLTLTSELLVNDSSGSITIDASQLGSGFTITDAGSVNHRLLHVTSGTTLIARGLEFTDGGGNFSGNGGGILNEGTLTLDRCTVSECAASNGGGLYADTGSTLTMDRCTVTRNRGTSGGGLFIKGSATLTQCALVSNTGHTGATLLTEAGSSVNMLHDTAMGGYASVLCSGVLARGTLRLQHCVFGQNSGAATTPQALRVESGTTTLLGVNVIENITGTVTGTAPIMTKPLLTSDGHPLPGSPAIDQAPVMNPALTSDVFGHPRPLGLRPDLGAIEGPIVVTTAVDELDRPGALGAGVSLREAVRDAPAGHTIAFDSAVFRDVTTLTLTKGPLNPQRNCTLLGGGSAGFVRIVQVPTITAQPRSLSVAGGVDATFAVTVANASGGVTYAWKKNGSTTGNTSNAFHIYRAQETDEAVYDVVLGEATSPGIFTLTAVEMGSFNATSQPASLIVDGAPLTVLRGPESAMLALGSDHTLNVVTIGPTTPTPTYQWRKNNVNIAGATQSHHTIINAQLAHAGAYTCVVKSGSASTTSTTAEIGVVDTRAKTVTLRAGASFTAAVSAAGNDLSYVWTRDGIALPSVAKSFVIKPVAASDNGHYSCTVTGPPGQLTDGCNTYLDVSAPTIGVPTIVSYPLPQAYIGLPYSWQVPVQLIPSLAATVFNIRGLPAGLTYSATTGIISGRPTVSKPDGYRVTLRAGNAQGYGLANVQTLMVNALPNGSVGTFAGPMPRSPLNDFLGGRFDLTTTSTGTFSGSITLGSREKLSFTAKMLHCAGAGDVILYGSIPGITMTDMTPLTAYVEVFAIEQYARLTLVHPQGTTLITSAWRKPWSTATKATDYAATYTLRLDAGSSTSAPQGYGYASFTTSTAGTLTLAGKLPDGSAVTGGTHVGPNGEIMIFNLLYGNLGSHVGQFSIAKSTSLINNAITGTTSWLKPRQAPSATDTVYPKGFGPLSVTAAGGVYDAPSFIPAGPDSTNASLAFTLGGLVPEFTQLLRIVNPSTVTLLAPISNTTRMTSFSASSGLFAGSFTLHSTNAALDRAAPFFGQFVTIGTTTVGYGYFLLPKLPMGLQPVTPAPRLSGRVVLTMP